MKIRTLALAATMLTTATGLVLAQTTAPNNPHAGNSATMDRTDAPRGSMGTTGMGTGSGSIGTTGSGSMAPVGTLQMESGAVPGSTNAERNNDTISPAAPNAGVAKDQ